MRSSGSSQRPSDSQPLLDRLIRDSAGVDPFGAPREIDLREAVRRDLEKLLNTRWRFQSYPSELSDLERSLIQYGIPDFTGASFADAAAQRDFCRVLQRAVQLFEPRLRMVRIVLMERGEWDRRSLRFRIEGVVGEGAGQRTVFESQLDPLSSTFRVGTASA